MLNFPVVEHEIACTMNITQIRGTQIWGGHGPVSEGKFFFGSEDYTLYGPYSSQEDAEKALALYTKNM